MSLIKQLWLGIVVVAVLSFGGSLIISTLSARHYLEQQLYVKNVDNATSLALALSQLPKDAVMVELQVAAQFDAGHYRLIRLTSPDGTVIVERRYTGVESGAPDWFIRLVPISARAGVAQVQDGWQQFGTLTLESHSRYAYEALWNATLALLAWFLAGAVLTGFIGTLLIKHVTRPLGRVVEQAQAIGGRRFITTEEPSTLEFRSVVRAMNTLSERVRTMLSDESHRLELLRRQAQHDALTGLYNRSQFLNTLDAALARRDGPDCGILAIVRIGELSELNRALGRNETDHVLTLLAERVRLLAETEPRWEAGRLNASDFALLAPGATDAPDIASALSSSLAEVVDAVSDSVVLQYPIGAGSYRHGEDRASVLARIDGALAAAEQSGANAIRVDEARGEAPPYTDLSDWRIALMRALDADGVRLGSYAVVTTHGELLHCEAPMRVRLDGVWHSAGVVVPRASRLGLLPRLDAAVVHAAVERIRSTHQPVGINVSADALSDTGFRSTLHATLQGAPDACSRLWVEFPEYGAVRHLPDFRALCIALKPLGCKLGIEHVGRQFSRIGDLHDLGLDYIKVDAAIVCGIDTDIGNQSFLRGLCVLAHAIGLTVIATGVTREAELTMLRAIGLDAATGPVIEFPDRKADRDIASTS
ncbi:MAG TPA: LapD/MoxY N-terminal periplasmic domain-containing protein [Rhodocyclaceae bacterium]|nr:LapD/MoxY N-terminal periplasmic domain-containing protein [Rhodocyclaceae bacterium]